MKRTTVTLTVLFLAASALAQEGVFLTEEEAPRAVFPDATRFERRTVESTPDLHAHIEQHLSGVTPSMWEEHYLVVRALRDDEVLGQAFVVEELGKHRPITFVVGLRPDGSVNDVAVMAYREPYGGEVRSWRFLGQYRGKRPGEPLRTYREITNVAGATLSVDAASRAVRKAQALHAALSDAPANAGGDAS